jgi:hypothetical protein
MGGEVITSDKRRGILNYILENYRDDQWMDDFVLREQGEDVAPIPFEELHAKDYVIADDDDEYALYSDEAGAAAIMNDCRRYSYYVYHEAGEVLKKSKTELFQNSPECSAVKRDLTLTDIKRDGKKVTYELRDARGHPVKGGKQFADRDRAVWFVQLKIMLNQEYLVPDPADKGNKNNQKMISKGNWAENWRIFTNSPDTSPRSQASNTKVGQIHGGHENDNESVGSLEVEEDNAEEENTTAAERPTAEIFFDMNRDAHVAYIMQEIQALCETDRVLLRHCYLMSDHERIGTLERRGKWKTRWSIRLYKLGSNRKQTIRGNFTLYLDDIIKIVKEKLKNFADGVQGAEELTINDQFERNRHRIHEWITIALDKNPTKRNRYK